MHTARFIVGSFLVLGFASGLDAQVTSPSGFLSKEGNGFAMLFGLNPDAREMFVDGTQRGAVRVIRELAYRLDDRNYSTTAAAGRSWSHVGIDFSWCDAHVNTNVFSKIATGQVSRVFSNPVTWPTVLGRPSSRPAAWGSAGGSLRFPFSFPVVSTGQTDICFDFTFRGGTLANSAPWSSAAYFLDSYVTGDLKQAPITTHGNLPGGRGCSDSNRPMSAFVDGQSLSYGPRAIGHALTTFVWFRSYQTPAGMPVVHVLGAAGSPTGVAFPGVSCNRLHVDFSRPAWLLPRRADTSGNALSDFGPHPFNAALVGTALWFQAAWTDSDEGRIKLTPALETSIVSYPADHDRWVVRAIGSTSTFGSGPLRSGVGNPIVRYGQ